jgi:hypothetical protein
MYYSRRMAGCQEINFMDREDKTLKIWYFNSLSAKSVLAGEKLVATYSIST